jgi:putative transposase
MPRLARAIAPGIPHHITQRGNRRQTTFFQTEDYLRYLALLADWCERCAIDIWAYCLMPNHVHLIAVPPDAAALRRAIGETHRQYTSEINEREGWRGCLWQGRFASFAMDARYTRAAARYIELNPVRSRLVAHPGDYPWSSARAHLLGRDDGLVSVRPLLDEIRDWAAFLGSADATAFGEIREHETTGRPLGSEWFVQQLEVELDRALRPMPPGPQPGRRPVARA